MKLTIIFKSASEIALGNNYNPSLMFYIWSIVSYGVYDAVYFNNNVEGKLLISFLFNLIIKGQLCLLG